MRYSVIISFFALAIVAVCLLPACTKDGKQTQYTRIAGKWRLVRTAVDDNANGTIDASEIHPVDTAIKDEIQFNADSTGVETITARGTVTPYAFTYSFGVENTLTRYGVGSDTISYFVAAINSSNLQLTATLSSGIAGYYYNRE